MESSRNDVSQTCSVGFVFIDVFTCWTLVIHRSRVPKVKLVYFLELGKKSGKKHKQTHLFFRIWLIFPEGDCLFPKNWKNKNNNNKKTKQTDNTKKHAFFFLGFGLVIFGFAFLFIFLCNYWFGFYWAYLKNSTYVKKVKKMCFSLLLFIKRLSAFLPITDTPSSGCSNTSLVLQLLGYLHNCTCRFSFHLKWCLII